MLAHINEYPPPVAIEFGRKALFRISILVLNAQAQRRIEHPDAAMPAPPGSGDNLSARNDQSAAPDAHKNQDAIDPKASSVSLANPGSITRPGLLSTGLRVNAR